ncbi:hypothetical protein QZH41_012180 [Actinostola sp. cb2023]|nr:hypothetical protein QZH41_012180 [Actinostola sp. cb2023]
MYATVNSTRATPVPHTDNPPSPQCTETQDSNDILTQDIGRKLTFDNFDIHQKVHHMTEAHQNIDKHYVTMTSTKNRVCSFHLSDTPPEGDILTFENGRCIPNHVEHNKQRENYIVLVSRIITSNINALKHLGDTVIKHIPHKYSKEMAQSTQTTFLGLLYHNENSSEGILEILKELHKYVPFTGNGENRWYADLGVAGDQLTVERAVNGHASLGNGFTPEERLDGLHFEIADWHAGNKFLQVAFDHLYSAASSRDKCTLYSDRNLINRRNVKTRVDSAVKPAHSLFDLCLKARIIAATLAVMGIGSVDDECHDVPKAEDSKSSKADYLFKLASKVVDDYVLDGSGNELLAKSLVDDEQDMSSTDVRDTSSTDESASKFQDDMFSYQRALLEYGLLLYNFKDSVNEGDGTRIIRCWKFFLLHLKNSKSSTKYALKALYLMFQVYALLSPKAAHELIWNRSVKLRNNRGGNIPLDLQLEFYNRILKGGLVRKSFKI